MGPKGAVHGTDSKDRDGLLESRPGRNKTLYLVVVLGSRDTCGRLFHFLSLIFNFFPNSFPCTSWLSCSNTCLEEIKTPKHQGQQNKMDRETLTQWHKGKYMPPAQ